MITIAEAKQFMTKMGMHLTDNEEHLTPSEHYTFMNFLAHKFALPIQPFHEFLSTPGVHPDAEQYIKDTLAEGESLLESIGDAFETFAENVQEGVEKAIDAAGDMMEAAADKIEEVAEEVKEIVEDVVDALDGDDSDEEESTDEPVEGEGKTKPDETVPEF